MAKHIKYNINIGVYCIYNIIYVDYRLSLYIIKNTIKYNTRVGGEEKRENQTGPYRRQTAAPTHL